MLEQQLCFGFDYTYLDSYFWSDFASFFYWLQIWRWTMASRTPLSLEARDLKISTNHFFNILDIRIAPLICFNVGFSYVGFKEDKNWRFIGSSWFCGMDFHYIFKVKYEWLVYPTCLLFSFFCVFVCLFVSRPPSFWRYFLFDF